MAASFPTSIKSFATRVPGAGIGSAHVNELQEEVVAIETWAKGGGSVTNKVSHVTKNAVQAIPTAPAITKVIWQVATRDDLTMWSVGANTRLTVTETGYYDVFFYGQLEGSAAGSYSWACLYVNNIIVHYAPPIDVNAYGNQLVLNFRGQYTANDYLEIGVHHNFESNKNIVVSILPVFSAVRLG